MPDMNLRQSFLVKLKRKINGLPRGPLLLKRIISEKRTYWRNRHPKVYFRNKDLYYPKNFIGNKEVDLTKHVLVHNDLFPETDIKTWLDRDDADEQIKLKLANNEISESDAQACRSFSRDGYFVAKGLFSEDYIDEVFGDYENAIDEGRIGRNPNRRILNPHHFCRKVNGMIRHKKIMHYNRLFLGEKAVDPFQSIGSEFGSEQLEHSDAVHMTTYPLGYMTAAWVSCDDVQEGAGELMYYPGSNRLPYNLSKQVGFYPRELAEKGRQHVYHELYEPFIQQVIEENNLKKEYLYTEKGDVLFWHHNLIHGGTKITDHEATRKAFVFHYFAKNVVRYHELSGSLARIPL